MKRVFDRDGTDHVWLDARHLDCAFLRERFPTVYNGLKARGYDLCTQLIPIAPASHYFIGGALTDTWGRTTIPGLYACGETASTGIHGANRLASNSLLEGLVFGDRTVRELNRYLSVSDPAVRKVRLDLADEPRRGQRPGRGGRAEEGHGAAHDRPLRHRPHQGGTGEGGGVAGGASRARWPRPGLNVAELELFNLLTVARHIVASAADAGGEPGRPSAFRLPRARRRPLAAARADRARRRDGRFQGLHETGGGVMSEDADLRLVRLALAEDLAGYGDITSELTVPADLKGRAVITARTDMVVCGLDLARTVMQEVDSRAAFTASGRRGAAGQGPGRVGGHRRAGARAS